LTPDEALTPNEQVAVPAFSKSLPANPDTAASIDNVNATDAELVGDDTADENDDTDGAVVSIVTNSDVDIDDVFPAASRSVAAIDHVPSDKPVKLHEAPSVLETIVH